MNIIKKIIVFLFDCRIYFIISQKIHFIYNNINNKARISKKDLRNYKIFWKNYRLNPKKKWYKVYASISGYKDPRYISEYIYYTKIEPRLNHRGLSEAFCDKNLYHKFIDHKYLPRIFLRNIEGVFYNEDYDLITSTDLNIIPEETLKLVLKNSLETGGGRNIEVFHKISGSLININGEDLFVKITQNKRKKNYLLQEYIEQDSYFKKFNPSSVNTVRILTYRSIKDNRIIILQAVLRIGRRGQIVDNQASGGYVCGIEENGTLRSFAIDKFGHKYQKVNNLELNNESKVLFYKEICLVAKDLARLFPYHRLLGFDFAIDLEKRIRLIEINNRNNEINFYQMNNGPLFREYTEEILQFIRKSPRYFALDYEN